MESLGLLTEPCAHGPVQRPERVLKKSYPPGTARAAVLGDPKALPPSRPLPRLLPCRYGGRGRCGNPRVSTPTMGVQPAFGFAYELPHGAVLVADTYFLSTASLKAPLHSHGATGSISNPVDSITQHQAVLPGARLSDPFLRWPNSLPPILRPLNDVGLERSAPPRRRRNSYEQAWSLGIQKQLPGKSSRSNYVGKGHAPLPRRIPRSELLPASAIAGLDPVRSAISRPHSSDIFGYITDPLSRCPATVPAYQLALPFPSSQPLPVIHRQCEFHLHAGQFGRESFSGV